MKKRTTILSALLLSIASGCVSVPNTGACSVAGVLSAGMNCSETLTGKKSRLTLDETIEFLEPQPERPDPDHPGETLPERGGAICQSAFDWNLQKTALEQACRELGKRCTYEMKQALENLK